MCINICESIKYYKIKIYNLQRMFMSEQDELCLRNRGTEYIKSPEMLTLTIN